MIEKTSGIVPLLRHTLASFGEKIQWAFVYGSLARGEENAGSDVDLMLIGAVTMMEMAPLVRQVEKTVGRAVNPTIFTRDDFKKSIDQKNHFLLTVLQGQKIMLQGTEDELETAAHSA